MELLVAQECSGWRGRISNVERGRGAEKRKNGSVRAMN